MSKKQHMEKAGWSSGRETPELHLDYAHELNPQQFEAVTAPPGPALVLAGAGSGKTRVLTYRVAFLLEQGIPPQRILLLTFTNKAAQEMMHRVTELLGREQPGLWGGTFHGIGLRILRRHAQLVGYQAGFTVLDQEDAQKIASAALQDTKASFEGLKPPKAEVCAGIFSLAANTAQTLEQTIRSRYSYLLPLLRPLAETHQRYLQRKLEANVMDFDDLLTRWLEVLETQAEVAEYYQRHFQFILVDEYQDTNTIQSGILNCLAARHQNLLAVGDDAQSIYSWRGANYRNILEFPRRFPAAKVYKIETNYRSTPQILHLANAAIAPNVDQFQKELTPSRKSGPKPHLIRCTDVSQEAEFIREKIRHLREQGVREIAVLYRAHFHAMELQLELTRQGVPFKITSGLRFFEQAHIKDVAAYLRILVNPADELAFTRLVQMLPGVGAKGAGKMWQAFHLAHSASQSVTPTAPGGRNLDESGPVEESQSQLIDDALLRRCLTAVTSQVSKKSRPVWEALQKLLCEVRDQADQCGPSVLIGIILKQGYAKYLTESYENAEDRLHDLERLADFASKYSHVRDFLAEMALQTNAETEEQAGHADDGSLRLSTIHQAKGLEFQAVFVIRLYEGLFPSQRSIENRESLEEERRLFYVALTRAKDHLFLTYPAYFESHYMNNFYGGASRFLKNLPVNQMEQVQLGY